MTRFQALATIALLGTLFFPGLLGAQEKEEILSYDVIVEVMDGGLLQVTENIEVRALGLEIQRGIYRDFPTGFPREWGMGWIVAPFEVVSVSRDGVPEPYSVENVGGPAGRSGARVRIGDQHNHMTTNVGQSQDRAGRCPDPTRLAPLHPCL